jgi:hypothetical protein
MLARQVNKTVSTNNYPLVGGYIKNIVAKNNNENMYKGPEWFTRSTQDSSLFRGIYRK